ncbi:MAG: hypothetical protein ACE5JM_03665 [Armatimonadota bacterium]
MTIRVACVCVALVVLLLVPAVGQEAAAPTPPATGQPDAAEATRKVAEGEVDPVEFLRQMGAKEEDILGLQLMAQVTGADMGELMLLMMLADQGKKGGQGDKGDDMMGMLLFMKALGGGGGKQPTALLYRDKLLVIEDGTVYRIDPDRLEVDGSVKYRANKGAGGLAALLPLIMQAKQGKAQVTSCQGNVKQLCMAAHKHAGDAGQMLPTEQWQDQLDPYLKNRAIYACPDTPGNVIGYAINEALIGARIADVKRPSETVLFFESDQAQELPFGGPDAVTGPPRHDGHVVVGFVDGHVQRVSPEELRALLARNPFQ